jgi:hypothetical protein
MPKSKKYRKKQRGYKRKLANAPNLLQHNRHEPIGIGYDYNRLVNIPIAAGLHYENNRRKDLEGLEALKRVQNRQDHMDRIGIAVDAEKAYNFGVRAAVPQTMGQILSGLDKKEKKGKKAAHASKPKGVDSEVQTIKEPDRQAPDNTLALEQLALATPLTRDNFFTYEGYQRGVSRAASRPASAPPPASPGTAPRQQLDRDIEDSTNQKIIDKDVFERRRDLTAQGFLAERTPKPSAREPQPEPEPEPEPELDFGKAEEARAQRKERRKAKRERAITLPPTTTAVGDLDVAPGEVLIKPERTTTMLGQAQQKEKTKEESSVRKMGRKIAGAMKPGGDHREPAQRVPRGQGWLPPPTPTRAQRAEQAHKNRRIKAARPAPHDTPTSQSRDLSMTAPSFTPSPLPGSGDPYSKDETTKILGNQRYMGDTPSPESREVTQPKQLRRKLDDKLDESIARAANADQPIDF